MKKFQTVPLHHTVSKFWYHTYYSAVQPTRERWSNFKCKYSTSNPC